MLGGSHLLAGTLARWHSGMLACWHAGTLACWHTGMLADTYAQLFQLFKHVLDLSINSTCYTFITRKCNNKYRQINHWVGGAGGGRNRRLSGNHGTHYNIYTDKNGLHKISAGGL